eukprot:scaffold292210_cov24-Attheya_sp.AAC.1
MGKDGLGILHQILVIRCRLCWFSSYIHGQSRHNRVVWIGGGVGHNAKVAVATVTTRDDRIATSIGRLIGQSWQ